MNLRDVEAVQDMQCLSGLGRNNLQIRLPVWPKTSIYMKS
jgi:hypothetical protein